MRYDADQIRLIKSSGAKTLTFGVESGSDRILKLICKDITSAEVLAANKRAKEFGFLVNYHFMIGFPDETREDIAQTTRLIYTLSEDRNVRIYGPSVYIPYPGTPLLDRCVELGLSTPNRLEEWVDYDWRKVSQLPCFSRTHRRYMAETLTVCTYATLKRDTRQSALRVLAHSVLRHYFRFRLLSLSRGFRLFDLDTGILRLLKHVLLTLRRWTEQKVGQVSSDGVPSDELST